MSWQLALSRIPARLLHPFVVKQWNREANKYTGLPPADEFLEGATAAYTYFTQEITEKSDVSHLKPMVSPQLYRALNDHSEDDDFRNIRDTIGLDTRIEFRNIETYLQDFSGLSDSKVEQEQDMRQLAEWGIDGPGVVTAGVRFLSEQAYGWEEDEDGMTPSHFRNDLIVFGASYQFGHGVGDFKILTME